MYINSRPNNTAARILSVCLSVSQSGNTVKLYVIGLYRLSHFPGNCRVETQVAFFINATGKGKVVYTTEWQCNQTIGSLKAILSLLPILLYQVPYFSVHLYFDTSSVAFSNISLF